MGRLKVHSVGPELGAELSIGELVSAAGAAVSPALVTVGASGRVRGLTRNARSLDSSPER